MSTQKYQGLSDVQVKESRENNGVNKFSKVETEPTWKKFLSKFTDPLIIILLIACVASFGISYYQYKYEGEDAVVFFEPLGIVVAILLATGLAFFFEQRAEDEFSVLNQVNDEENVKVIRNGLVTEVPKKDIVVGDIVILSSGDEIPADGELLEATAMKVDESALTGEPLCKKSTITEEFDSNATYPTNYVLRGSNVMEGHGVMVVKNVGDQTEQGKVHKEVQIDNSVRTPLNEQLDRLSNVIAYTSYALAALVIIGHLLNWLAKGDGTALLPEMLKAVMIAVSLIVVAVPEGLPMAVTLSLAYSMRRMLKTNNLARTLHACETMGACTIICTDKTGTLTQNKMKVIDAIFYGTPDITKDDTNAKLVCESISCNTTAMLNTEKANKPKVIGNPTEGALLVWLNKLGIDFMQIRRQNEVIEELPFTTERKYMATIVKSQALGGKKVLFVKGAPEIVKSKCTTFWNNEDGKAIDNKLFELQSQAKRTLGFAYKILEDGQESPIINGELTSSDLTLMGIISIADPVRKEVPAAIEECKKAGIKVMIITGDTPATAKEIGRQTGIWTAECTDKMNLLSGPEIATMSDEELQKQIISIKVVSRARPTDKKRIVEALQRCGEIVAVTGDGTNDAPALKAAHVGLSMGDGTSVAKEASDITIVDNSFSSIGRAVMWGRSLFLNIKRFILFQMTVNVVACLVVLFGAFMGMEMPFTVTQMLWVNLIMDTFAAMALASLPPSEKVMKDAPRDRNKFIISKGMGTLIAFSSLIMFTITISIFYQCNHFEVDSIADLFKTKSQQTIGEEYTLLEHSIVFTSFVFLQFWNLFNAKTFGSFDTAFHLKECGSFLLIAATIIIGQILIVQFGKELFSVNAMSIGNWIGLITCTSFILIFGEIFRFIARKRKRNSLRS